MLRHPPNSFEGEAMNAKPYRNTPKHKAWAREYMRRFRKARPGYQAAQDKKYYEAHTEERRLRGRENWHLATPEKRAHIRQRNQRGHLRRKYNMTPEDKQKRFKKQRGRCYLCKRPLFSCLSAVIDHSHYDNAVRGLAHRVCNIRLGWIEKAGHDDPQTLKRMLRIALPKE